MQCATLNNSIILDFFSGSGTTADAVMRLNAEDGGNRKFIMVQLPEICEEKSEANKAGYKTICEVGKERIRRAGKKIKEEFKLIETYDMNFEAAYTKLMWILGSGEKDYDRIREKFYSPINYDIVK